MSRIAGGDTASVDQVTQIFRWGSRPWEPAIPTPLVVEQRDAASSVDRSFYFALEAGDLGETPRLPRSTREEAFAREVDKLLQREGPSPWPVYVFSADSTARHAMEAFLLASTRRIIVRDGNGAPEPAVAILLNRAYWGANGAPGWDDRLTEVVARHELYHARRTWLRAEETAAHADAIEVRLHDAGIRTPDRTRLECLVRQAMIAREEVEAVDRSFGSQPISPRSRQSFLEYREKNRTLQNKMVKAFAGLFATVIDAGNVKELEKWLTDLLQKDLKRSAR